MAMLDVKLPDIGEGVTEGELVKWLVKVGDTVKMDQPICELMTDKATVEIPSHAEGVVKSLSVKEGDVVPVGKVILSMEATGGAKAAAVPSTQTAVSSVKTTGGHSDHDAPASSNLSLSAASKASSASVGSTGSSGSAVEVHPPAASQKVLATPSTRRLARESNVDINNLAGTGLAGRVTRDDVVKATTHGAGATAAGAPSFQIPRPAYQGPSGSVEERVPLKGVRKKIAEKMQLSKQIVPHFTLMDEANVSELVRMRSSMKEKMAKQGVKVTYLPFIMKTLIATSRQFPMFNASIDDASQEIVYKKYFNLGFAADTPQGLLVPVIKNADQKTILQLSQEIVGLSEKARAGKLAPDEMKGATMSITNIGSVGGTYATPIINHPEVAILGMYKVAERAIVVDGQIRVAHMMNVTITADHRLIDGAVAANFLKAFIERLENPSLLMMDLM